MIPEIIFYNIKGKTIAFSLRSFEHTEIDYRLNIPFKIPNEKINVRYIDNPYSINDFIVKTNKDDPFCFEPNRFEHLYINTTNVCLANCEYCYAMPVMINNNVVNYEKLISTLKKYNSIDTLKSITLLGGEPLLNLKLIKNILEKSKWKLSISTGLFISDKTFDNFLSIVDGYIERLDIQVSVDPKNKWRIGPFSDDIENKILKLIEVFTPKRFSFRGTLCKGDVDYRKFRNKLERKTNSELTYNYELVSEPKLMPDKNEIDLIINNMLIDAQEYLNKQREYVPLNAIDLKNKIRDMYDKGHKSFFVDFGCSIWNGDAPVLTPDSHELKRCTQPVSDKRNSEKTIIGDKCKKCPILRYCGVKCPSEAEKDAFCTTEFIKTIIAIYIYLWEIEDWN